MFLILPSSFANVDMTFCTGQSYIIELYHLCFHSLNICLSASTWPNFEQVEKTGRQVSTSDM